MKGLGDRKGDMRALDRVCARSPARPRRKPALVAAARVHLQDLRPPTAVSPDAAEVAYEGPALFVEARVPIDGYYA